MKRVSVDELKTQVSVKIRSKALTRVPLKQNKIALGAYMARARALGMSWSEISSMARCQPKTAKRYTSMYERWESSHEHAESGCGCRLAEVPL